MRRQGPCMRLKNVRPVCSHDNGRLPNTALRPPCDMPWQVDLLQARRRVRKLHSTKHDQPEWTTVSTTMLCATRNPPSLIRAFSTRILPHVHCPFPGRERRKGGQNADAGPSEMRWNDGEPKALLACLFSAQSCGDPAGCLMSKRPKEGCAPWGGLLRLEAR
ncbi:predicted protein [Plenodomus lingam JN3]|uniref:Predicted protein n=1 Tax=Leptosphaeria maculans (strain JN3 / isolate v23.1.3 / race Av1-4-5-6-7-8) TaxID=985895 RepID=E4ZHJ1_LEPMJ|nr:predicted protein [Plenodomus lingam JN3]CBX90824.1 predicted protein [Plenodomus lingam JN3]